MAKYGANEGVMGGEQGGRKRGREGYGGGEREVRSLLVVVKVQADAMADARDWRFGGVGWCRVPIVGLVTPPLVIAPSG